MTIIDTTTYCNGELRLAKHGAGKGGTVLVHAPSGEQIDVHPESEIAIVEMLADYEARRPTHTSFTSDYVFHSIETYHDGFINNTRS